MVDLLFFIFLFDLTIHMPSSIECLSAMYESSLMSSLGHSIYFSPSIKTFRRNCLSMDIWMSRPWPWSDNDPYTHWENLTRNIIFLNIFFFNVRMILSLGILKMIGKHNIYTIFFDFKIIIYFIGMQMEAFALHRQCLAIMNATVI